MKRRIFALALACALSLALLTSCGGNSGSGSSVSSSGSDLSSGSSSSQDGSDVSAPGSSLIDGSQSEGSQSSGSASSSQQPDVSQPEQTKLTLNRTEFALFTTGSSFRLKAAGVPEGATVTWKSSNDKVASVGEDGTVTYVATGNATITATAGDLTATCKVYCKAEDKPEQPEQPNNGGSSSGGSSSSGSGSSSGGSSSQSVDLKAFADTVIADYEFPFMGEMSSTDLSNYLPGLSDLSAQLVAYTCLMSPSPAGDLVLVQVKDSKDVAAVKDIFQARIDNMVGTDENPGAAWYPEPIRMWKEDSRIVSNGNYVMLVVSADSDSIVKDFNALF